MSKDAHLTFLAVEFRLMDARGEFDPSSKQASGWRGMRPWRNFFLLAGISHIANTTATTATTIAIDLLGMEHKSREQTRVGGLASKGFLPHCVIIVGLEIKFVVDYISRVTLFNLILETLRSDTFSILNLGNALMPTSKLLYNDAG